MRAPVKLSKVSLLAQQHSIHFKNTAHLYTMEPEYYQRALRFMDEVSIRSWLERVWTDEADPGRQVNWAEYTTSEKRARVWGSLSWRRRPPPQRGVRPALKHPNMILAELEAYIRECEFGRITDIQWIRMIQKKPRKVCVRTFSNRGTR